MIKTGYIKAKKRFIAEHPSCQRCHLKPSFDIHHSHGKLGALLTYEPFWFALCRGCHDWIHANIGKARKEGFICEKGLWNTQPPKTEIISTDYLAGA